MSSAQNQALRALYRLQKDARTDILNARAHSWEILTFCSSLVFGQSTWLWKETAASPVPEEQLAAIFGRLQFALDDRVGLRTGSWMVGVLREGPGGWHFGHLWSKKEHSVDTLMQQRPAGTVSASMLSLSDANTAGYHFMRKDAVLSVLAQNDGFSIRKLVSLTSLATGLNLCLASHIWTVALL